MGELSSDGVELVYVRRETTVNVIEKKDCVLLEPHFKPKEIVLDNRDRGKPLSELSKELGNVMRKYTIEV